MQMMLDAMKLAYHFMVQKIGQTPTLEYRLRNMLYAAIS